MVRGARPSAWRENRNPSTKSCSPILLSLCLTFHFAVGPLFYFLPRQVVVTSFVLASLPQPRQVVAQLCGAGDETRTRDNLLGRQGLYQLSYSRKTVSILALHPPLVKNGSPPKLLDSELKSNPML